MQGVLIAGTNKGNLRVYAWPINEGSLELEITGPNKARLREPEYVEIIAHSYPVVTLCASHD